MKGALALSIFLSLVTFETALDQGRKDPTIKAFADSVTGLEQWLRVDVLRVDNEGNSKDPTNIGPDGALYYKAKLAGSMSSTEATTVEDFEEAARMVFVKAEQDAKRWDEEYTPGYTWKYKQGSNVVVDKINLGKNDIKIEIKEPKGRKTALRLKFEKEDYTLEEVRTAYIVAFASSEVELVETVTIELGMTIEQIVELKGPPNSKALLGEKTILVYDDMKLVFVEGKLVDVQ